MSLEKVATEKTAAVKPSETGSHAAFLIGTYFSGSTLLGNCLNAHPSIFFAGEIDRLEAFRREPDWTHGRERGCRLCSTQAEHDCPAWPSEFLEKIRALDDISAYRAVIERNEAPILDRKSTRLNSSHDQISYAVFCLKKKKKKTNNTPPNYAPPTRTEQKT